jgi:hypothetical protein
MADQIDQKIMEQYRLYCLQREQRLTQQRIEKEKTQAIIREKEEKIRRQCQPHTVTTRKPHNCTKCGATIPAKSRVVVFQFPLIGIIF